MSAPHAAMCSPARGLRVWACPRRVRGLCHLNLGGLLLVTEESRCFRVSSSTIMTIPSWWRTEDSSVTLGMPGFKDGFRVPTSKVV